MARKRKKSKGREKSKGRTKSEGGTKSPEDEQPTTGTSDEDTTSAVGGSKSESESKSESKSKSKASTGKKSTDKKKSSSTKKSKAGKPESKMIDAAEGEEDAPVITPSALAALGQLRAEGVAKVPAELILDLGETSSPEARDRLLAAALAHVEMQDAIYRVPTDSEAPRFWKGWIAALLFFMAVLLATTPPGFLVPEPPASLRGADRLHGVRVALVLQAEQIEAFRTREQRLPESLSEVETAFAGIRFVRSNDRVYQLIAYTPDGYAVVYDSAARDPAFDEVADPWTSTGGAS